MSTARYDDYDDYYRERRWRDRLDACGRRSRGFPWGVFLFGVFLGAIIF